MDKDFDSEHKKFVFTWSPEARVWRWEPRGWFGGDEWLPAKKAPADLIGEWRPSPLIDETELWLRASDPHYGPMASAWTSYTVVPNIQGSGKLGRRPKGMSKVGAGHVVLFLRLLFDRCGLSLEDALRKRPPGKPSPARQTELNVLKVGLYAVDSFGASRSHIRNVTSLSNSQTSIFINHASTVFPTVRPWLTQTVRKEDEVSEVMQELKVIGRDVADIKQSVAKLMDLPELTKRIAERLRLSGYSDQDIAQAVDDFLAGV
jgi:hypothetical protein